MVKFGVFLTNNVNVLQDQYGVNLNVLIHAKAVKYTILYLCHVYAKVESGTEYHVLQLRLVQVERLGMQPSTLVNVLQINIC
jgi:hypothetical protein